jgi:hypothetical protein
MRRARRPALRASLAMALALALALALAGAGSNAAAAAAPAEASGTPDVDLLAQASWLAIHGDGVSASVATGPTVPVRLHFDFAGHGGYAGAHRTVPLDFPDDFLLRLRLRAHAGDNNLEIKFIDASGDNVWWINRRGVHFTGEWQTFIFKRRHVEFAWGPARDRTLHHTAALELVISAGNGGAGDVEVTQLLLAAREPTSALQLPVATASSKLAGFAPANVLDGDPRSAWRSDPMAGPAQYLELNLGGEREFGGLTLQWLPGMRPSDYEVQALDDEERWVTLRRIQGGNGKLDRLYLPESESRRLRVLMHAGSARGYGLAELQLENLAFGASINSYFTALAASQARGEYPRGYHGEQSYWTVVGNSGGGESGLLSEDGAFELRYGGPSLEPWLLIDGRAYGWAQVAIRHELPDGYLPMPRVLWQAPPFHFTIDAFARGASGAEHAVLRYVYRNATAHAQQLTFALLARPFQVNPPTQFLNGGGGASPIHDAKWDGSALRVNGQAELTPLLRPDDFSAARFDEGALPQRLLQLAGRQSLELHDDFGYGAVALRYHLKVAPHATVQWAFDVPWSGEPQAGFADPAAMARWLTATYQDVEQGWRALLNRAAITGPPAMQALTDTLRSALAQVLINRNGPAIQPGTRSYRRSWIRDGALSSAALLALGHEEAVRDYLDWYVPYVYPSGKVPCCVDTRGADPVPENDSAGELLFLAAEYYRYTGDRERLARLSPTLQRVADYLAALSQSERTAAHQFPSTQMYYGLMPPSISHEGYSAKPMHSYWDDFWALKGFDDALRIAQWLNDRGWQERLGSQAAAFRRDLFASLSASTSALHLDFLPGAAELGDFDATSTTIALSPQGESAQLPAALLRGTFERYWRFFTERRAQRRPWDAYTPYEIRNVGALLRLGWPERAREALEWFMRDRRPAGWNQWAEVVGRDPRQPRFVGDMPHGWVASDFIRSATDLFAYERESDQSLVLAAGVDERWLNGAGIRVDRLRTAFGPLSYQLRRVGTGYELRLDALAKPPPGGVFILLHGREAAVRAGSLEYID